MADMSTAEPLPFPPLHRSDVLACQFSSWYPRFKRHAPKATIIRPIPHEEELLEYLESDGLFLPEGSGPNGISELSDSDSEEEEQPDSDSEDDEPVKQFSFPELDVEIRSVLSRYEGAVFPKLNWSSPQDAAWMIPGQNLKCQNPADVYLLLKSSDFISHDLDHAFDDCIDFDPSSSTLQVGYPTPDVASLSLEDSTSSSSSATPKRPCRPYSFELVLKKWFDMPKSQEWRCFIRSRQLVGISQRDTTFYDFLQPQAARRQIIDQISSFWSEVVKDEFPLQDYTLDVYLTRDQSRTFIIDFNPYSSSTDSLLFTYSELASLSTSLSTTNATTPILKIVESENSAGALPRYSHNRYPKDVVELSEGQSVAEFAKVWGEKLKNATLGGEEDGTGEGPSGSGKTSTEEISEEIVGR
ncbi:cell proliferation protein CDC123 [Sporobolomyces salmoneus]|uniref:cell proliferation protein CDC123 n=1 Tax=Sporobolomyces salmoneus TaxID=183962 RepID=UPI00317BE6C4